MAVLSSLSGRRLIRSPAVSKSNSISSPFLPSLLPSSLPSFSLPSLSLLSLSSIPRILPNLHFLYEIVGETLSNQLQACFTLLIALVIGFTSSWKITLVVIATFPINVRACIHRLNAIFLRHEAFTHLPLPYLLSHSSFLSSMLLFILYISISEEVRVVDHKTFECLIKYQP